MAIGVYAALVRRLGRIWGCARWFVSRPGWRRAIVLLVVTALAETVAVSLPPAAARADTGPVIPAPSGLPDPQPAATDASLLSPPGQGAQSVQPGSDPASAVAGLTEVVALRTANSSTYVSHTPGHYIAQVFSRNVHYLSSGVWKDIDPRLVPAGTQLVKSAGNAFGLQYSLLGDSDHLVQVSLDGSHSVAYGLAGARPTVGAPDSASSVMYPQIQPGVDLRLTSLLTESKEELTLAGPTSPSTFVFPLVVQGLSAQMNPTGGVDFVDETGVVRAQTPGAWMQDSAGGAGREGVRSYGVSYNLVATPSGQSLQMTLDPAWLADPARVYPVTVDPNVQPQANMDDTYVSLGYTNNNSGDVEEHLGDYPSNPSCSSNCTNAGHPQRSFLHFDVSAVAGKTINDAQFYLFQTDAFDCLGRYMSIYQITSAWSGSSVQQFTTYANGAAPGSPLLGARVWNGGFSYKAPSCGTAQYAVLDATTPVTNWANGSWAPDGVALMADDETSPSAYVNFKEFNSENTQQGNVPLINIDYTDPVTPVPPNNPDNLTPATGNIFQSMPQLGARYTDPNNPPSTGTLQFRLAGPNGYSAGVDYIGQGCTSGCFGYWQPPAGPDGAYSWYVYGHNGWGYNSNQPWPSASFTISSHPPTVGKAVSPATVAVGQAATYTVTLSNPEPFQVTFTSAADTLDQALVPYINSIQLDGQPCTAATTPACSFTGSSLAVSSFTLAANASRTLTFSAVAVGSDRDCAAISNVATATDANGTGQSPNAPLGVCGGGLGNENWWGYVTRSIGPQATAAVDVADGNLVVTQTDSTPVPAHGHLAYVLRRSYNSQDPLLAALPGSVGAGWQLAIGQADDLVGDGVGASGLYVPSLESALDPGAVTLIDRDGTRHVFRPNALSAAVDVTALGLAAQALAPEVLPTGGVKVCVDQTYAAPAGVHLALWRYVQIASSGSCANLAAGSPVLLGFAAERPDRLRTEFSADGHLLDMTDGAGVQQRYVYDNPLTAAPVSLGNLRAVYEPGACATGNGPVTLASIPDSCRAFRLYYPSSTEIDIYDPAGRQNDPYGRGPTKYLLDAALGGLHSHLTSVVNPDTTTLTYTYGPNGAGTNTCPGASADQLCSASDPRGHTITVAYTASAYTFGLPRVASLTDRRGNPTAISYGQSCGYSTDCTVADQAGHRQRFREIDSTGRVGVTEAGDTANNLLHQQYSTWDGDPDAKAIDTASPGNQPAVTCRTDGKVDNDLCHAVATALNDTETGVSHGVTTADTDVAYTYNPEGQLLVRHELNKLTSTATATNQDTTYGYHAQYITAAATTTYDDTVAGNGTVTAPARAAAPVLLVLSDRTQQLPPRGNNDPAWPSFRTDYQPDDNTNAAPNTAASATCGATNTGLLCETDAPAPTGAAAPPDPGRRCHPASDRGTAPYACTTYAYDPAGEKTSMASPKANAETPSGSAVPATIYTYYADGDLDLSGSVSAGGWLRAVTDPSTNCGGGCFAAFGYDRAGNQTRVWDRNATNTHHVTDAWYNAANPPSSQYTETLHGSGTNPYVAPWRYVLAKRDPLGNQTTFTVDVNGNPTDTASPRGNHTTSTYDNNDNLLTVKRPAEANPTGYAYDPFNNRTQQVDPTGATTLFQYDSVNRQIEKDWSRSANPADAVGACQVPTTGLPSTTPGLQGHVVCSTTRAFDGHDNVYSAGDGNHQNTTAAFDSAGRRTDTFTPRAAGVVEHSATVYDPDGNITETCPPRQLDTSTPGHTATCGAGDLYATYRAVDPSGHLTAATTHRDTNIALNTTVSYDADGNATTSTDPNGHTTTTAYDLLDRKTTQTVPRDTATADYTTTTWLYDPAGNTTAVIAPGGYDTGNGSDGPLVVDGTTAANSTDQQVHNSAAAAYVIPTGRSYTTITIQAGGWATAAGSTLDVHATSTVTICATCTLTVAGLGGAGGAGGTGLTSNGRPGVGTDGGGPGASSAVEGGSGGGGGHATAGTAGGHATTSGAGGGGGASYNDTLTDPTAAQPVGSGGGGGGWGATINGAPGGAGGGYVHLTAGTIDVEGTITADGNPGGNGGVAGAGTGGGAGGGGSGGGIWLTGPTVTVAQAGSLSANGGPGGTAPAGNGGTGGAGRIRIDADTITGGAANLYPYQTTTTTIRHYAGRITAYSYDFDNRPVDTVAGANTPNANDGTLTATGTANRRTRVLYDADGNQAAVYDPRAFASSITSPDTRYLLRTDYDADGRPSAKYVPRYDQGSANDTAGTASADQRNQCSTSPSPQAVPGVPGWPSGTGVCVTKASYDGDNNITQIVLPTSTSNGGDNRQASFAYFDDNLLRTVNAPSPADTLSNDSGRVTAETHVYDGDGKQLQVTDANSYTQKTTYTLDELPAATSQLSGTTDLGHTTTYGYDADGHPSTATVPPANTTDTDAASNTTTTSYTADGKVSQIQAPGNGSGNFDLTTYGYDAAGNPISVKSPSANAADPNNTSGTATTTVYFDDNLPRTTTAPVSPNGALSTVTTYGYDAAGRKTSVDVSTGGSDPGKQTFTYSNTDLLVSEIGRSGNDRVDHTYDPAGQPIQLADAASSGKTGGSETFTYYLDGQLRTAADGTGIDNQTFAYDGSGQPTYRADNTTKTTYQYLAAELPAAMTSDVTAGTTTFGYDPGGRPTTETDPNHQTNTIAYNGDNTVHTANLTGTGGTNLAAWTYTYNARQQIAGQTFSTASSNGGPYNNTTFGYQYQSSGRLSQFTDPTGTNLLTWNHNGDRLTFGPKHTSSYNADDTLNQDTHPDPTGQATVTNTIAYNNARQLTSDGCTTNTYDGLDRLIAATPQAGAGCAPIATTPTVTYNYDGLDRQTVRAESGTSTAATTQIQYNGTSTTAVIEASVLTTLPNPSNGTDTYEVSADGTPKALTETKTGSTSPEYLSTDGQGNVSVITNNSATVDCLARFNPFGQPEQPTPPTTDQNCNVGASNNDIYYRMGRRDQTTGSYQMGSRTYDPGKAAFLTPDTYRAGRSAANLSVGIDPLTRNTYTYANGDPINLIDPTGHDPCIRDGQIGGGGCNHDNHFGYETNPHAGATGPTPGSPAWLQMKSVQDDRILHAEAATRNNLKTYAYNPASDICNYQAPAGCAWARDVLNHGGTPAQAAHAFCRDQDVFDLCDWHGGLLDLLGAALLAGSSGISAPVEATDAAAEEGAVADGPIRWGPHNGPGPLDKITMPSGETVASTFRSGSYTQLTTTGDMTLYHAYGGGSGPLSPFWTGTIPSGPLQAQLDLALNPAWNNTAEAVSAIRVPAGTEIFEGIAGPQGIGGGGSLLGGGSQIYIPWVDPGWLLP